MRVSNSSYRLILTIAIVALLAAIFLFSCRDQKPGDFKPLMTPAPPATISQYSGVPLPVTFSELQSNLAAYENRLIEISGSFAKLPTSICRHPTGPQPRWALANEEIRLNGVGFEQPLALAPSGVPMTIAGIVRRYQGPLGCGKEPQTQTSWYLELTRIIAPNPLPNFQLAGNGVDPEIQQVTAIPTANGGIAAPEPTPDLNIPPADNPTAVFPPTSILIGSPTAIIPPAPTLAVPTTPTPFQFPATATPAPIPSPLFPTATTGSAPTATSTASSGVTLTPTATNNGNTATPTGDGATSSPTLPPQQSVTPPATPLITPTPQPVPPTFTPGPYGPPTAEPTPTPTPDPY